MSLGPATPASPISNIFVDDADDVVSTDKFELFESIIWGLLSAWSNKEGRYTFSPEDTGVKGLQHFLCELCVDHIKIYEGITSSKGSLDYRRQFNARAREQKAGVFRRDVIRRNLSFLLIDDKPALRQTSRRCTTTKLQAVKRVYKKFDPVRWNGAELRDMHGLLWVEYLEEKKEKRARALKKKKQIARYKKYAKRQEQMRKQGKIRTDILAQIFPKEVLERHARRRHEENPKTELARFCDMCGTKFPCEARYCYHCGARRGTIKKIS